MFTIYCFSTSFSNGYFLLTIPYIGKYNYRKSVKCFDDCEFNYSFCTMCYIYHFNENKQWRKYVKNKWGVITMKKVPVFVVLIGCVFSWLIASMNPVTKIIDQSTYSYFNYQLMAIGFAISLLVGIILLWVIKRNNK